MALKIKKAFSLCFKSAKYNSTVNVPYVYHITEFIQTLSEVLCSSNLRFETFQHFFEFLHETDILVRKTIGSQTHECS